MLCDTDWREEGGLTSQPSFLSLFMLFSCPPPQQTRGKHSIIVGRQLLRWQGHGTETQVSVGVLVVCFGPLLQPPKFVLSFSGHRNFASCFKKARVSLEADTTGDTRQAAYGSRVD